MPDVTVVIPTFRRPLGLERLLVALANLRTRSRVRVLVADNDAKDREGLAVVARLVAASYRWPVETLIVAERGVAQARNALVAHALASGEFDYLAMLDDDEWPEPDWLDSFLRVAEQTRADGLHGAVVPDFEIAPGRWSKRCYSLAPRRGVTGPVAMIHSTSNVLLRRAALASLAPPWFDPQFGLSGGEDKEFFTRLKCAGGRLAWADSAIVHAHVPATRSKPLWVLQRAFRAGNSDMHVFIKHNAVFPGTLIECAKIAAALGLSLPLAALLVPLPEMQMLPLCKFARAAGKLWAALGLRYNEYAVVHGR